MRLHKANLRKEREAEKVTKAQEKKSVSLWPIYGKRQRDYRTRLPEAARRPSQLNARIDRLIAEEIEKARKRAAEEARREAAARKKIAAKAAKSGTSASGKRLLLWKLIPPRRRPRAVR